MEFRFCKVSLSHADSFRSVLLKNGGISLDNILCLGTRNGREIDAFRYAFHNRFLFRLAKIFEIRRRGWTPLFGFLESFGRSALAKLEEKNVIGCELNPQGSRKDVFVGSFDEMPKEWSSKFDIVYSNSIDQCMDPEKTATEWNRVLKPGGIFIISWADAPPTESDPLGDIALEDIQMLFPGELIFFGKNWSTYHDAIIRKSAT